MIGVFLAGLAFWLAAQSAPDMPLVISACDRVEVLVEDPAARAHAEKIAATSCRQARRLTGLFHGKEDLFKIRISADMNRFKARTGKPWFIGAALVGEEIVTQPVRSLNKMSNPEAVLTHEMVHLIIRRVAGRNCPRWIDEGLAQWLAGQKSGLGASLAVDLPANPEQLRDLDRRLTDPARSREQTEQDYRTCLLLVDRLIRKSSLDSLLGSLPALLHESNPDEWEISGNQAMELLFSGS